MISSSLRTRDAADMNGVVVEMYITFSCDDPVCAEGMAGWKSGRLRIRASRWIGERKMGLV